jgi:hypothetical protein
MRALAATTMFSGVTMTALPLSASASSEPPPPQPAESTIIMHPAT